MGIPQLIDSSAISQHALPVALMVYVAVAKYLTTKSMLNVLVI